jgi:K+-sensing histidine kinase KdpD
LVQDIDADVAAIARIDAVPTILEVLCRTTGMRFAAVARVTEDHWVACAVRDEIEFGLKPGGELKVDTTICDQIRASGEPVVIDHVAEDADYCGHPTPAMYGFQSYISMPIRLPSGKFFGTLCAIDPLPAKLKRPETIGMCKMFADLVGFHLDAQERLQAKEAALLHERERAELREQLIAVLGHDLRSPLAALVSGVRLLQTESLSAKGVMVVDLIQETIARMSGLVDNVLDFARGRLGGGLDVYRRPVDLGPVLKQVIAELRAVWPNRMIEVQLALLQSICCDRVRMAQLVSSLVENALAHGAADAPVRVWAACDDDMLEVAVANGGEPIPMGMLERLFEPFARNGERRGGLGLGLYIAAEIAKAHGGRLDVSSTADETRFTFRMPLR